jgi:hypothetical protein
MSIYDDIFDVNDHDEPEENFCIPVELIWKDPEEFNEIVDKEIGRETFESMCKSLLPACKSIEEISNASQNNGITGEIPRQRVFNRSDEDIFNSVTPIAAENNEFRFSIRYFEKQEGNQCAKHSINNMLQGYFVTLYFLLNRAEELKKVDKIDHVYPNGDFDNEVIKCALRKLLNCDPIDVSIDIIDEISNSKSPIMVIVTHNDHHYSARRFYNNGPLWLFNSLSGSPIIDNNLFETLKDQMINSPLIGAPQTMALFDNDSINLSLSNSNLFVERKLNEALDKIKFNSLHTLDEKNKDNEIEAPKKRVQQTSSDHQIEDRSRKFTNDDSLPKPKKLRGPTKCDTDSLFDEARKQNKKLVVFKMKNYSKLTIEDGVEFHECKKNGMQINEENTRLVNDALENGQRVRRKGRNFVLVGTKQYTEGRIKNNECVEACRSQSTR